MAVKVLPIHIVDDHNEALEHIYRYIGSKALPYSGISLVHFDSHPDLLCPELTADQIYNKECLFEAISIGDWILPGVYAGHFSCIIWLKPPWSSQIQDGQYQLIVGKHKCINKLRVSLSLPYYINEGLYCTSMELENVQTIPLYVITVSMSTDVTEILESVGTTSWILDIDLDFFSTANPFLPWFTKEQFSYLKELYQSSQTTFTENEASKLNEARVIKLKTLEEMWSGNNQAELNQFEVDIKSVIGQTRNDEIVRPCDIHIAGLTSDLPHHISTADEIQSLIETVAQTLKKISYPPTVLTIARSCDDGYTPLNQVDNIQQAVIDTISKIYSPIVIHTHYVK